MKTLQEILPYYLGTGLKCQNLFGESSELLGLTNKTWFFKHHNQLLEGYLYQCKPLLRPLSSLTKPITVEGYNGGKPFVPSIHVMELALGSLPKNNDYKWMYFQQIEFLCKLHFNVFNLPTDQFIEIKD